MREYIHRIDSYSGIEGEYILQVDFILKSARIVDSEFNPPLDWSDQKIERIPHTRDITSFKMGDSIRGIETTHKVEYESILWIYSLIDLFYSIRRSRSSPGPSPTGSLLPVASVQFPVSLSNITLIGFSFLSRSR